MQGAEEPIVVTNFRPMKTGNSTEDKTGRTLHLVAVEHRCQKRLCYAKGRERKTKECEELN